MQTKPQVIVTAKPDGTVEVETVGVVGPDCEKLSSHIEAAIGAVTSNVKKPEYHKQPQVKKPVAQQAGQQ